MIDRDKRRIEIMLGLSNETKLRLVIGVLIGLNYYLYGRIFLYYFLHLIITLLVSSLFSIIFTLLMVKDYAFFVDYFWLAFTFSYFLQLMFIARWRKLTIAEMILSSTIPDKTFKDRLYHSDRIISESLVAAKKEKNLHDATLRIWSTPYETISYLFAVTIIFIFTTSIFLWSLNIANINEIVVVSSGNKDLISVLFKNIEYFGDIVLFNFFTVFDIHLSDTVYASSFIIRMFIFSIFSLHIVNIINLIRKQISQREDNEIKEYKKSLIRQFKKEYK